MEYLRRLAPARAADPTRAVAVLPSRFSGDSPLRATPAEVAPQPGVRDDAEPASAAAAASPATAASPARAAQARAVPPAPAGHPFEHNEGAASASPAARTATSAAGPARAGPSARAPQAAVSPDAPRRGAGPAAPAPAPFEPARAGPLSPAILAERSAYPAEDNQVVHVSIGRIDVVANVAPAPAAPRAQKPRPGSVALADYLRGDNGSRR